MQTVIYALYVHHGMAKYVKKLPDVQAIQKFTIENDTFWAVPSASDASKVYEVRKPTDKYTCNCFDYQTRHIGKDTECKHGQAVRQLESMATVAQ